MPGHFLTHMYVPIILCTSVIDSVVVSGCHSFGVGSSWRQRSRAGGAGSDDVLEPLSQHSRAAVLPQYHHRGSCMSLDANGESVLARSSLVCMSC